MAAEATPPGRARTWSVWAGLLVASVLFRLPALINARGVHSDAAIVGLQAMHLLEGEWSWFLWGAGYQASFDAVLIALGFALTGPSALTLMVVPLIGHLIATGLAFDVVRRKVGWWGGAIATLPLVFAPQAINGVALYAPRQWSVTAVFVAIWLLDASTRRSRSAPWWLAGGAFVAMFALYLDLYTLQFMVGVGLFGLWCAARELRPWPSLGWRVGGLALGALLGRALLAWSRSHPMADATKALLTWERAGQNWALLVDTCMPYLLGAKVFVPGGGLYPDLWVAPWPVRILQGVGAWSFIAAVAWAGLAVFRRRLPWDVRRLGVLGFVVAASAVGGFLASPMPADLWSTRYLASIVWMAPFTLAPLAYELSPRRFGLALAPYVLTAALGSWMSYGPYVNGPLPVRSARGAADDEAELGRVLRERGVKYAAAQYWLSYRLGFLFEEDPIVVPLAGWEDRYAPYREGFAQAPVVAYLFHPSEPRARPEQVEVMLRRSGARYERVEVRGFTALIHHRR